MLNENIKEQLGKFSTNDKMKNKKEQWKPQNMILNHIRKNKRNERRNVRMGITLKPEHVSRLISRDREEGWKRLGEEAENTKFPKIGYA